MKYPAVIDGERGAYGVVIPDMPGACCAMGSTVDEALADAEEMLPEYVAVLEEQGVPIPPPSAIADIELAAGEMLAYVTLKIPAPAVSP
ncbi:MAG: type II toxin-antitoxin system HicB family antitoxin [Chloroflexota bacterium]|nr:type II toxin-antitoxin system HicB family antitoxin [Chloroflexota bacterium]